MQDVFRKKAFLTDSLVDDLFPSVVDANDGRLGRLLLQNLSDLLLFPLLLLQELPDLVLVSRPGEKLGLLALVCDVLCTGFIFGRLARDPHLDNFTRRRGYSWGPSGFCDWRRGAV